MSLEDVITVSFGPAFDAKEQVRQAIDIVDLGGSYVQLRRQGRNFVGLCPWHDDSQPSLQVNPDRQSFKCWVCDYGGDVFSFIMRSENLEFREALELLAERAGINCSLRNRAHQRAGTVRLARSDRIDDKRTLYRVAAWAEEQFHRCLLESPEAEPGRVYLAERGITHETIQPLPPRLRTEPLGLDPGACARHASGRPPSSNASACCDAKNSAAASTIGSAAA